MLNKKTRLFFSSVLCELLLSFDTWRRRAWGMKMWFSWRKGQSGFSSRSTAEEATPGIDATGLTAIVTGASSGIGREITRVLALRGAHVIMAVCNLDGGREVKQDIMEKILPDAQIEVLELDLSSMASVRKFASEYNSMGLPLNILM